MIKITMAKYIKNYEIELHFSDNTYGYFDFSYLLDIHTVLTKPLHDTAYFKMFFLDFGALCWKNSLEFSADSLQKKMINKKTLFTDEDAA